MNVIYTQNNTKENFFWEARRTSLFLIFMESLQQPFDIKFERARKNFWKTKKIFWTDTNVLLRTMEHTGPLDFGFVLNLRLWFGQ